MILCDREIQALIDSGAVIIDPKPGERQWSSTAVDLRLHNVLLKWNPAPPPTGGPINPVQPAAPNFDVQGMMENHQCAQRITIGEGGYVLNQHDFVLGFTIEKVSIPHRCRIAARVEGKSSLARVGMGVHITAPTVHAGFGAKGETEPPSPIQLEIFNLGPWPIRLDYGMRICQLIFEEVREVPSAGYSGQFSKQQHFTVQRK
jgi:dCTP deaminase